MIISIDPGKACGMIVIKANGDVQETFEGDAMEAVDRVFWLTKVARPLHVVMERYTQTSNKMTNQPDALEMIGAVRWICNFNSRVPFFLQSRSERSRVTREMLVDVGLWQPRVKSPHGHLNEAARHAVVHITRRLPQHPIAKKLLGRIDLQGEYAAIGVNDGLRREA